MDNTLDTTLTEVDAETFRKVKECIGHYDTRQALPMLKSLFQSGVPANGYRRTKGGTPLTYLSLAYTQNRPEIMEYLIRLNYKGLKDFGWSFTPYLWTAEAAQALIDVGHDFAREIANPTEPFWIKCWHLKPDFFLGIGNNGARFDVSVVVGGVPYMPIVQFALHDAMPGVVEAMIATGSNPGARESNGQTVLHGAVTRGRQVHTKKVDNLENTRRLEGIARAVVDAGASIDMVDIHGQSALHLACQFGYFNKARILMELGADPHLKDRAGKTPEDLAREAKRKDVLQLFAATRARNVIMDVVAKAATAAQGKKS